MATAQLCVSIAADTTAELRARRDAVTDADLVELRLDLVRDPDVAAALAGRRRPVIVTCRPRWEGGAFDGSEEERHRLLAEAQRLGAEYIDVEWRAGFDDLVHARSGRGVVVSMHDFTRTPADLPDRARAMRASGAEVVKVAVHATKLTDLLPLAALGRDRAAGRIVVLGMGAAGVASRIAASRFGSCWTYAGDGLAPGQIDPRRLVREFRFREISDRAEIYGVVGSPLAHSLSPAMHNAAFDAAGRDAVYVPLDAADADDFLAFARAFGVGGASVTAPFKTDLFERADEVDEMSRKVGALNTLLFAEGRCLGRNTDVAGFLAPLAGRGDLAGTRGAVLGAGGAARAVAIGLASLGARVAVYARRPERAADVARLVGGTAHPLPPPRGSWDVLVNATPIGTAPHSDDTPIPSSSLDGRIVYDLVYNPAETRLLRDAAAAGCETIGGLDMLVAQAQLQFEWWTGCRLPAGTFKAAALGRLAEAGTRPVEHERRS